MTLSIKLPPLFDIQPGERRLVGLLFIHSFLLGVTRIFARTAAYTLFMVEFDATTLPYVYIGGAVVNVLVAVIYFKLGERLSFTKLLVLNFAFQLAGFGLLWAGLGISNARWVVFLLPIWFDVTWVLTGLEFWALVGNLLNVRQGKRLFGLVGGGMWAAVVVGGFLVPTLVRFTATANLLLLAATGLAGGLLSLLYISRQYNIPTAPEKMPAASDSEPPVEEKRPLRSLLHNRYVLLICALIWLWWIGFFIIDNIFYGQAAAQYPTEPQLAAFIGQFFAIAGLVTLFSSTLLAGPLISRFGIRTAQLIVPVTLVIGSLLLASIGPFAAGATALLFWLAAFNKLTNFGLGYSIDKSAQVILYQPLPASQRTQTLTLVEGIIFPLAAGTGGLVLLLSTTVLGLTTVHLTFILLVVLLGWITLVTLLGRAYPKALMQALAKRKLSGHAINLNDSSSMAAIQQALQSGHVGVVVYALDLLEANQSPSTAEALANLLSHSVPDVRQEALHRIERLALTETLGAVEETIRTEDQLQVKAAALRTLAALGDVAEIEQIYPYLEAPERELRLAAIVGLLRNGGPEVAIMAGGRLIQLAVSADSTERVLAAQVMGQIQVFNFYQLLQQLLKDNDPAVRRAALIAAGQAQHPKLWPLVLDQISSTEVRGAAGSALSSGGESVLPELEAAFNQPEQSPAVLIRLAQIYGRIRGDAATTLLKTKMEFPDEGVRSQVLRSLHLCGYRASEQELPRLQALLKTEAAEAAWTLAALVDIGNEEVVSLLRGLLSAKLAQSRNRLFYLLSFIFDAPTILHARDNLDHAHSSKRAYALEMLDLSISPDLKGFLLPLLTSDLSTAQRLQTLNGYFPQPKLGRRGRLEEMSRQRDEQRKGWLKSCALHTLARLLDTGSIPTLVAALSAPDPLVREEALWTLWRLNESALEPHLDTLRHDPNPQMAQAVSQLINLDHHDSTKLSMIEKVVVLKNVSIFSETPIEILAELARLLQEVRVTAGKTIFNKGELGDCLYIIATGQVRVSDGEQTLDNLGPGDEFGELAVLEPEPRAASVTASQPSLLLRLDQKALYDLMDDRIEVTRGIIRVLLHHLRAWVHELTDLKEQMVKPEASRPESLFNRSDAALESQGPLSTLEKVIILKTVHLFSRTPDPVMTNVAALLEEVNLRAGETIFEKGEPGDCMYIIVSGKVQVHDEAHLINYLSAKDLFGEMAVLDPEPRLASVTAVEDTHLLRLDQEPLYELMEDDLEVVRGIIRVLLGHLRNRVRDVTLLRTKLRSQAQAQ